MKIKNIKINSYGKLKNEEINLNDNINLIYGKNESGKSTLLRFIVNSFYGISKNKKGKEFSDYDTYYPWADDEFSGKIEYQLDNGKNYEVYRDFKKKNPKIFNEEKEDISKEFNIDKLKGNEFFYEQTKIDEEIFLSTIVSYQQQVRLEKGQQNFLVQKIANLVGTGDDNVSYRIAMDRITRRQRDEIGSEKSREKPINILSREIENLEKEKEELQNIKDMEYTIEENRNKLEKEILEKEKEKEYLSELKLFKEKEKIEKETIKLKENIQKENIEKIFKLKNKLNQQLNENKIKINKLEDEKHILKNEKKKMNYKFIIFLLLIFFINIFQIIFIKNIILNSILFLTLPIILILWINSNYKKNKKIKIEEKNNQKIIEKIKIEENNLENEIKIIEKNNQKIEEEIKKENEEFNLKNNLQKEKIKNKYKSKFEENKILIYNNLEDINETLEKIKNKLSSKKIELHSLELDRENIEPKLDNLSKIEEKLVNHKEKMVALEKLNRSMNLAKEVLEKSYNEMKNIIAPKFTRNMSKNISEITGGKYKNVRIHDELGLIVELEDGNYVEVSKLSVGTIDQLYLSLRLSMIDELSEEKMPIFLDESFAYFDSYRLENILKYLAENFKQRQIVIFTCTNREKDVLMKLNIPFQFIEMEK